MPAGDFCPTSVGIRRNSDGMHNQVLVAINPKPSFKFRHLWSKPCGWLWLFSFPPLSGLWQSCHPTGQEGQGALTLGWEMRYTAVVRYVGRLGLNISCDMMKAANPVIGDGLENAEELFLQGEYVIFVRLANDRRSTRQVPVSFFRNRKKMG